MLGSHLKQATRFTRGSLQDSAQVFGEELCYEGSVWLVWLTSFESRVQRSAGLTSSIRARYVEVLDNRQINDTSTSSNCRISSFYVRSSLGEAHHRAEFAGHQQRRHSSFTRTACRSLLQEDDAYKLGLTNSDQRRRESAGREGGKQLLLGVEAVRCLVWVICCREP